MPPPGPHSAAPRPADPAFAALAAALWAERDALDLLHYRLVTARALLGVGATRWLNRLDDDVREALAELRAQEVIRAAEAERLTALVGLRRGANLQVIIGVAPPAWAGVLRESADELRDLLREMESGLAETQRLLAAGAASARQSLAQLPAGSRQSRRTELADLTTSQFALQLATTSASYEAALRTVAKVSARSLQQFVA